MSESVAIMSDPKQKQRWTEADVRRAVVKLFAPPAYVWLAQVRNGTGCSRQKTRTADAIGVSVWPSRGLYMMGVEIKVSRSDWRKELADGSKAEAIAKYCRYWYVAAPKDVVPAGEVPENWGLIECSRGAATVTRAAATLEPNPPDMPLICSVLRASAEASVPCDEVSEKIEEAVQRSHRGMVDSWEYDRLKKAVGEFERTSGLTISDRRTYGFEVRELGRRVALVKSLELGHCVNAAGNLLGQLKKMCDPIRKALEDYQAAVKEAGVAVVDTDDD